MEGKRREEREETRWKGRGGEGKKLTIAAETQIDDGEKELHSAQREKNVDHCRGWGLTLNGDNGDGCGEGLFGEGWQLSWDEAEPRPKRGVWRAQQMGEAIFPNATEVRAWRSDVSLHLRIRSVYRT